MSNVIEEGVSKRNAIKTQELAWDTLDALMQISYNGMDLEADNMDGMNCHGLP
jgi:hypothetical protein